MQEKKLIKINNKHLEIVNSEYTLLQLCELNSLYIPRFCYHDKLSIAGNCRMCLVELETSIKPIIACSTSIVPNMSVFTNSNIVKKIRENILEFLLINHPLDCPICDQGGECDLQDQSMVFGSDRGRFIEMKRSVEDKNFGPFIKTIMTRCIHCTRCVRFFDEIAGVYLLGTMGRGRDTEIGTYTNTELYSELSGNVIDLCPVGALTSKPYAFTSRPWELTSIETIDIFDSLGSNIRMDVKGNTIMRVLPKLNENINEEWISDQIRFSYDGFRRERLTVPLVKIKKNENNLFNFISWKNALLTIKLYLELSVSLNLFKSLINIVIYAGDLIDLFSLFMLRSFIDSYKNDSLIYFHNDYVLNNKNRLHSFFLTTPINNLHAFNNILFYNINLRKEISVLNVRIRKLKWKLKDQFNIFYVGPTINLNYKFKHLGISISSFLNIIKGKHFICNSYINSKLCIFQNINVSNFNNNLSNYTSLLDINNVSTNISELHYNLLGFENNINANVFSCDLNNFTIYYLLNYNKPIKSYNNKYYMIYQGHHGNINIMNAHLVLPTYCYTEMNGYYMNLQGFIQKAEQVIYGPSLSKLNSDVFVELLEQINSNNSSEYNYYISKYQHLFKTHFPFIKNNNKINFIFLNNAKNNIKINNRNFNNFNKLFKKNIVIENSFIYNKAIKKSIYSNYEN